ncbi:hypothetical protein B9G55_23205 [Saccharibacillus sp. O16]|nr:hypothetical protein B9G55_23205 [Saccharibacillus sp. O16]
MNGSERERRLEAKEESKQQETQSPIRVLTWERVQLKDNRIAQPWHKRLREIRGDQDLNF